MHFQKLELKDFPVIRAYYDALSPGICDYTTGALFMWRSYFKTEYCIEDDTLFTRVTGAPGAQGCCQIPFGALDPKEGIERIIRAEHAAGRRVCIAPLEEKDLYLLEGLETEFTLDCSDDDAADYIYDYADFTSLSGKRNHKKKNHINQFDRACGSWRFEMITPAHPDALKVFLDTSYHMAEDPGEIERVEMDAVREVPDHYEAYGMTGGVLYADERIAGFTVGECVGETLFVHIEKADITIPGAYQKLNHEYALRCGAGMKWINREDDSGDPGLRRSKLSYHPVRMGRKYIAEEKTLGSY